MKRLLTILLLASAALSNAATLYRTPRLERIARAIHLTLPDTLRPNMVNDSIASYFGKAIGLHTNGLGDVSHIGYHIFSDEQKGVYRKYPVFDFIERYLLELDLRLDGRVPEFRMDIDQVVVVKGDLQMLHSITPNTSLSFSLDEIPRKMYRLTWKFDGKEVKVTFPMDSQLLIGGNMIELEQTFVRDVQRMVPIAGDAAIVDWDAVKVSHTKEGLVVKGGSYMIDEIRGDIYLSFAEGKRELIYCKDNPTKSVSNIMLTGMSKKEVPMSVALRIYGNRIDTLRMALQQFIAYCKMDGCKLFYGTKMVTEDTIIGTLYAYNERCAYTHMLPVVFPLSILDGNLEQLMAKGYVYIPLHDITEKYITRKQESKLHKK